jgi:AcrR family transcriptional regulator
LPAETREKILQAAFRTLSRRGYENTTVKDIAEEAGVAPGLLHYYFKSKQALVLSVLAMCCAKMQQPHAIDSTSGVLQAFEHFKASLHSERDSNGLYIELIGVGLHDPEVAAGVLGFVRQDRANIEAAARDVLAAGELPSRRAPALAAAVWGATLGIMIQHLVDPEFDADAAVDALAAMAIATVTGQPDLP